VPLFIYFDFFTVEEEGAEVKITVEGEGDGG
jgi:hypothetical protein